MIHFRVKTLKKTNQKRATEKEYLALDSPLSGGYNTPCAAENRHTTTAYGGVAQLARAFGSYPECHLFESDRRYHKRTVILIESYRSFSLSKKPMIRAFFAFFAIKVNRYGVF